MVEQRRFADVRAPDDGDERCEFLLVQSMFLSRLDEGFTENRELRTVYYRDSSAFLIPSRVSSRECGRGILPVPVFRAGGRALENAPCLRVSSRPVANGPGGGRGPRRKAAPDRRGRHWYRQNAGLSAAGNPLRQTSDHLNRHEEPAGAALL